MQAYRKDTVIHLILVVTNFAGSVFVPRRISKSLACSAGYHARAQASRQCEQKNESGRIPNPITGADLKLDLHAQPESPGPVRVVSRT